MSSTQNRRWYRAHTSVTTGNRRMVLLFTFPATWAMPLSQTIVCTYSQPCEASSGCTVAQPTSVFQNHSVLDGVACLLQAATCGWYQAARPLTPTVSPWKPRMP
jgi:hypothetical protein